MATGQDQREMAHERLEHIARLRAVAEQERTIEATLATHRGPGRECWETLLARVRAAIAEEERAGEVWAAPARHATGR